MRKTIRKFIAAATISGLAIAGCLPAQGATPRTKRVNVRANDDQAEGGHSYNSSISTTGRFVAFESYATDLVGGDDNGLSDVFVRGPLR